MFAVLSDQQLVRQVRDARRSVSGVAARMDELPRVWPLIARFMRLDELVRLSRKLRLLLHTLETVRSGGRTDLGAVWVVGVSTRD